VSLVVLDTGLLTTVQDLGRHGYAHLGVPRAGALDAPAAALANRLVGNEPSAAVLETTLTGATVRLGRAATVAVTGAECDVRVDGRHAAYGEPVPARHGAEVVVGPARRGIRSYLAVSGGIDVEPVLGSRSTDTLAGVGPPRLAAGDEIPLGSQRGAPAPVDVLRPRPGTGPLRLLPGPRAAWITPAAWGRLTTTPYVVSPDSDRVGLRLTGARLERTDDRELPSEGIVLGSVQVPPSGRPVVFLHDHPVTGGYPVVAVVHPDDLPTCAQLRPGDPVRFTRAATR
jgi:biotin-dependent carboxylase-like uncharacterized protein